MSRFFELDIAGNDRWCLTVKGSSAPLNIWACCRLEMPPPMQFSIKVEGKRVDFGHTGWASIPVISQRMAKCLNALASDDIQCIPACVEGEPDGEWVVLNVLAHPDCVAHDESDITYYPPDHPEKPGKPRGVLRLFIDPGRVKVHNVFRPKDWEIALIVSQRVKEALEELNVTGVEFVPVTQ